MNKDTPTWYKLIEHWCRQRIPKGYGLTLPFIIGVTKSPTISHLLTEIKNSEQDEKIILQWCGDCSSPIIDRTHSDKVKLINFKSNNYEYKKINIRRKGKDCSRSRTEWIYRNSLKA